MHRAALHALGLSDWSYQRLPVPPELFAETVRALPASGFAGANVTIPHKEAALALATDATPAARAQREARAAEVLVWNRTGSRARDHAADLGAAAVEAPAPPVDLLVNCTAVGLAPEDDLSDALPGLPQLLAAARCVVDLAYGEHETRLIADARAAGAHTVDGLEVLTRQGALSLERWTGRPAPLEVMRSAASAR